MSGEPAAKDPTGQTAREDATRSIVAILQSTADSIRLTFAQDVSVRALVAKTVIHRQLDAIHAALALGQINLGYLAGGSVRQACEEAIWRNYLADLTEEQGNQVALHLGINDNARGLGAFRTYAGDDELVKLGFPLPLLQSTQGLADSSRAKLREVGDELGWPGGRVPPSTEWIARQTGQLRDYEFLFSASSRAVHFSAGEAFRNTWWDATNPELRMIAGRNNHQYAFALDRLVILAIRTLASALQITEGIAPSEEIDETVFWAAVKTSASLGRVPMITPEEYNIGRQP